MEKTKIFSLWPGKIEDIPEDWVLCDGDNDTPNLTNQFMLNNDSSVSPITHVFKKNPPPYLNLSWVMKKQ